MAKERDVVELVTRYLDGTLQAEDREDFERHVETCEACQRYLEQVRRATELTGRPPAQCLTPEFKEHLTEVFGGIESS